VGRFRGREPISKDGAERLTENGLGANLRPRDEEAHMSERAQKKGTPGPPSVTGAIDADGHILEPPDVWQKHIDPQYRDRAIGLATDANGWEIVIIDGKPSRLLPPGFAGTLGGMGDKHIVPGPERTYVKYAPFGSMSAKERIERITNEGLRAAILYPTLGILWESVFNDR
jgi:hypothetical protein